MKTSIILPILALAAGVFAQQPPACLLNAVNGQPDPSNLGAICAQKNATSVQGAIASGCGSNAQVAQSAFIATCSSAGSSVATYKASSTGKSSSSSTTSGSGSKSQSSGTFVYTTAVYNSDCSCTSTMVTSATGAAAASSLGLTATAAATSGPSASASGSGAASETGNVAADIRGMGSFAAAAIAVAGAIAAL